jgi:hypothetical protein
MNSIVLEFETEQRTPHGHVAHPFANAKGGETLPHSFEVLEKARMVGQTIYGVTRSFLRDEKKKHYPPREPFSKKFWKKPEDRTDNISSATISFRKPRRRNIARPMRHLGRSFGRSQKGRTNNMSYAVLLLLSKEQKKKHINCCSIGFGAMCKEQSKPVFFREKRIEFESTRSACVEHCKL